MNILKNKLIIFLLLLSGTAFPREYHVSVNGSDKNPGTQKKPLQTISAAALHAMPGDVITVHAGVYREQITPPRGGSSDHERITYKAEGEVIIKGSEVVGNWTSENGQVWKAVLSNDFFDAFNPFNDYLSGDWYVNTDNRKTRTGAVYLNGYWLSEAANLEEVLSNNIANTWFAIVDESHTTIYANFGDKNPNNELVEVNARQTIFYPEKTGINYITVRGFTLTQAATPWAPPTAEQKAIIGTNWSKGWIIEDNNISYSICSGIALGKHGDEFDNTASSTTEGYYETIKRALKNGWNEENIGHHIVRNNRISHCEQAGIVGSLGCIFSTVTGNEIHDIHVKNWYFGYEMAGIKFHGAVNSIIHSNHIFRCNRGLWLDWMAQGTIVTRNFFHDNDREHGYDQADLYMEVNHGPVLVANNLFLSGRSILNRSNGTAYIHNLATGSIRFAPEENRETPFLQPNSTEIMGYAKSIIEDEKWINNIFIGDQSNFYFFDTWDSGNFFGGNVYLNGARPPKSDIEALVIDDYPHEVKIMEKPDGFYLEFNFDREWGKNANTTLVTTEKLCISKYTGQPVVYPDDTSVTIDTDFMGIPRDTNNPFPGPFEVNESGKKQLRYGR
ncbi:DUF1565 domain-containing protein [Gaoshiqia sp. Z1-71]|uniref:DUF1565 domain-containing protein n=1 Tax=Gaoshiqia hydrogeniformans TaxID=3290090 RepID=UPI003BF8631C